MQPRDLVALGCRLLHLGHNRVEIERCGIDDARTRRGLREDHRRHQRARIEHDGATPQQGEPPHGDQVRSTGAGADEVDRHALFVAQGFATSPGA